MGGQLMRSLDRIGALKGVREQQAAARWDKAVGPQIAAASAVDRVRDGILFVCCKSSMWSNELSLHKSKILQRLNAGFRETVIKDMRLTTRGFTQAKARKRKEEDRTGKNSLETIHLDDSDRAAAERAAAQVESEALAQKIRKAVLTGRKRAKQRSLDAGGNNDG